ncbi:class I adenylate-forming enzyme family protein [Sphingomonas sp.]|uniref:class I adenylate-forming enzyme family protein n=1 Tax=Sphingomonas sp. TaxID=28214 RepID=UPI00260132BB|nr:class I adenylate-forming enzyme family protein [Sphingomonas sp.]
MSGTAARTFGQLLTTAAQSFGPRDAIIFPDRRLSYEQLGQRARSWAKALITMGVRPGENVGILLTTRIEFIELLFGITMTGAVAVPINARYQAHELAFLIRDADLVALFTTGRVADSLDFGERLRAALPSLEQADTGSLALDEAPLLRTIVCLDPPCASYLVGGEDALAAGADVPDTELDRRIADVAPEDIAFILYTSGTTANPKGALISHGAQIGNSRSLGVRYEATGDDKVWSPLPIFHIAGILPMTMILDLGGAYMTVPHFDAGVAIDMLGREGATIAYPSFVTIMQDLISHPSFASSDLSRLRVMNSNFAVQPDWIRDAVCAAVPHTVQVSTYGLTEAAGTVTTSRLGDPWSLRTGRCGAPLDDWQVRIVDLETEEECALGERGEIVIRGPGMLSGYYNAPEKTAEVMRDGWFHTGDIGSFDETGHIMFHGRTKDMLKVGGENVAAAEIESMLQSHPAVKLAQVVGIPDERYAEVPAAFVELAEGENASEAELIAHCRGKLASFKLPRHVRMVTSWPMSTSKIQKFRLRSELIDELEQGKTS